MFLDEMPCPQCKKRALFVLVADEQPEA